MRTSPVHYIAPSAISITPNANGSANDLAVYVSRGTKIKVFAPGVERLGINPNTNSFREWTLTGRNRRLNCGNGPYTIYARLQKSEAYVTDGSAYLVFAAQSQYGPDNPYGLAGQWFDKYSYVMQDGLAGQYDERGFPKIVDHPDYWWIKLGTVSELNESSQRTVELDTGILGTDQYNEEWALNPDELPLRVEFGCTIDNEDVGNTPYIKWGKSAVLTASLVKGWNGSAGERVAFWTITRNTSNASADAAWNHPSGDTADRIMTDGQITLRHLRTCTDDFDAAVAATFTVTAWAETGDSSDSGSSSSSSNSDSSSSSGDEEAYAPIASASITMLAETKELLSMLLSTAVVSFSPQTGDYTPDDGVAASIRATSQDSSISVLTKSEAKSIGLVIQYAIVGSNNWTLLSFTNSSDATAILPTSAFAAQTSVNIRLSRRIGAGSSQAMEELDRQTVAFVRDGEDSKEREWIFKPTPTEDYGTPPSGITGGEVNPSGAATGNDDNDNQDGWVPQGWYDESQGTGNVNRYEYSSYRDYIHASDGDSSDSDSSGSVSIGGHWGPFSPPKIWGRYGKDGADGQDGADGKDAAEVQPNLLRQTRFVAGKMDEWNVNTGTIVVNGLDSHNYIHLGSYGSSGQMIQQQITGAGHDILQPATIYTLSFWSKGRVFMDINPGDSGEAYAPFDRSWGRYIDGVKFDYIDDFGCGFNDADWTYHTITFKTASAFDSSKPAYLYWIAEAFVVEGSVCDVCMPKLERGETATAYLPNDEELDGADGQDGKDGKDGKDAAYISLRGHGSNPNVTIPAVQVKIFNGSQTVTYDLEDIAADTVRDVKRGLALFTIDRQTLAVTNTPTFFDVHGDGNTATRGDVLASVINSLSDSVFVVLVSHDAAGFCPNLVAALKGCGGSDIEHTDGWRYPFAFIGYKGLTEGYALQIQMPADPYPGGATAPALLSAYVANGMFTTAKTGQDGQDGVDGQDGQDGQDGWTLNVNPSPLIIEQNINDRTFPFSQQQPLYISMTASRGSDNNVTVGTPTSVSNDLGLTVSPIGVNDYRLQITGYIKQSGTYKTSGKITCSVVLTDTAGNTVTMPVSISVGVTLLGEWETKIVDDAEKSVARKITHAATGTEVETIETVGQYIRSSSENTARLSETVGAMETNGGKNLFGFCKNIHFADDWTDPSFTPQENETWSVLPYIQGYGFEVYLPYGRTGNWAMRGRLSKLGFHGVEGYYVVSMEIKASQKITQNGITESFRIELCDCRPDTAKSKGLDAQGSWVAKTEWQRVVAVFRLTRDELGESGVRDYMGETGYDGFMDVESNFESTYSDNVSRTHVYVRKLMIERGSVASAFAICDEDANYAREHDATYVQNTNNKKLDDTGKWTSAGGSAKFALLLDKWNGLDVYQNPLPVNSSTSDTADGTNTRKAMLYNSAVLKAKTVYTFSFWAKAENRYLWIAFKNSQNTITFNPQEYSNGIGLITTAIGDFRPEKIVNYIWSANYGSGTNYLNVARDGYPAESRIWLRFAGSWPSSLAATTILPNATTAVYGFAATSVTVATEPGFDDYTWVALSGTSFPSHNLANGAQIRTYLAPANNLQRGGTIVEERGIFEPYQTETNDINAYTRIKLTSDFRKYYVHVFNQREATNGYTEGIRITTEDGLTSLMQYSICGLELREGYITTDSRTSYASVVRQTARSFDVALLKDSMEKVGLHMTLDSNGTEVTGGLINLRADRVTFSNSDGTVSGKVSIDATKGTLITQNAVLNGNLFLPYLRITAANYQQKTTTIVIGSRTYRVLKLDDTNNFQLDYSGLTDVRLPHVATTETGMLGCEMNILNLTGADVELYGGYADGSNVTQLLAEWNGSGFSNNYYLPQGKEARLKLIEYNSSFAWKLV